MGRIGKALLRLEQGSSIGRRPHFLSSAAPVRSKAGVASLASPLTSPIAQPAAHPTVDSNHTLDPIVPRSAPVAAEQTFSFATGSLDVWGDVWADEPKPQQAQSPVPEPHTERPAFQPSSLPESAGQLAPGDAPYTKSVESTPAVAATTSGQPEQSDQLLNEIYQLFALPGGAETEKASASSSPSPAASSNTFEPANPSGSEYPESVPFSASYDPASNDPANDEAVSPEPTSNTAPPEAEPMPVVAATAVPALTPSALPVPELSVPEQAIYSAELAEPLAADVFAADASAEATLAEDDAQADLHSSETDTQQTSCDLPSDLTPEVDPSLQAVCQAIAAKLSGHATQQAVMFTDLGPKVPSAASIGLIASQLAQQLQTEVLLVDADLQNRQLSQELGLETCPGFWELLAGDLELPQAVVQTNALGVYALAAGNTRRDLARLDGVRIAAVLHQLKNQFGLVVLYSGQFDRPQTLGLAAASQFSYLMMSEHQISTARLAQQTLAQTRTQFGGCIVLQSRAA